MAKRNTRLLGACLIAAVAAIALLRQSPRSDEDAKPAAKVAEENVVYSWNRIAPKDFVVRELKSRTSPEEFRHRAPELSLAFRGITIEWIGPRDRELVEQQMGEVYEELRREVNHLECRDKTIIIWLYPLGEIGIVNMPALVVDERADPELKPWKMVTKRQWMQHRYNKLTESFADPF